MSRRWGAYRSFLPALAALVLAGCPAADTYQNTPTGGLSGCGTRCRSVGTSSGGAGGELDCSQVSAETDAGCPSGTVLLYGQTYDLCATLEGEGSVRVPLPGSQVQINGCTDFWVLTDPKGTFNLCVPPGQNIDPIFTAPEFATGNMAEVNLTQNLGYTGQRGGVFLVCDSLLQQYEQTAVGFDLNQGAVLILVLSLSESAPCGMNAKGSVDLSGWQVEPSLPDGGVPAHAWQIAYLDNQGTPVTSQSTTFTDGYAIIYNIDPSIDQLQISATRPMDDAGLLAACPFQNASYGFTGLVRVSPGAFGYFPLGLP